jgi:hypothetical protein
MSFLPIMDAKEWQGIYEEILSTPPFARVIDNLGWCSSIGPIIKL